MTRKPVLSAATEIPVGKDRVRAWFLSLADHPERYTFESHAGFTFTQGAFGEPGARFQTTERFQGISVTLKFELLEVQEDRFVFHLRKPMRSIWGFFELTEGAQEKTTRLQLAVGSDRPLQRRFLQLPGVRGAVETQITREVANIKRSIVSLTKEET